MRSLLFILPLLASSWAFENRNLEGGFRASLDEVVRQSRHADLMRDSHHLEAGVQIVEGGIRQNRDVNRQLPLEAKSNFAPSRQTRELTNEDLHQISHTAESSGRQTRHSDMHHVDAGTKTLEGGIRQKRHDMHHFDHHDMHHLDAGVNTVEGGIRQSRGALAENKNLEREQNLEETGRQARHADLMRDSPAEIKNLEEGIRQSRGAVYGAGIQHIAEQQKPLEGGIRQ